jgi:S-DNA-T family DNA segregation ATPase FtsK/SpoIIIE
LAQASHKRGERFALGAQLHRGLREGALILVGMLALIMLLSLISYHPGDPGWSHSSVNEQINNRVGRFGAWFSDVFLYLFGRMAYLFPFLVAYGAWVIYREEREELDGSQAAHLTLRGVGFVLTMMTGSALAFLHRSTAAVSLARWSAAGWSIPSISSVPRCSCWRCS